MSDGADTREDEIRARSAEILARQPTPEEQAEHAERVQRNRIDAIMARTEPGKPLRYAVNENALITTADDPDERQVRDIRVKADRGERLTPDEFTAIAVADAHEDMRDIFAMIDGGSGLKTALGFAVARLLGNLSGARAGNYAKRYVVEDRIAALEATIKPRVRIKAGSRVSQ